MSQVYKKQGIHPLIQKYNVMVDEINALEEEIALARKNAYQPKPIYKLIHAEPGIIQHSYRFSLELQNQQSFDDINQVFGECVRPDKLIHSAPYHLINNVLLICGGGNVIFGGLITGNPLILSNDEWQSLINLKLPKVVREACKYYQLVPEQFEG